MKRVILPALFLAGFVLAAQPADAAQLPADAAPAGAKSSVVENAGWKCGPLRCVWLPDYTGPNRLPPNAPDLGEPLYPGCHWRRIPVVGRWRMVCP